jgi:hypothetical protein
MRQDDDLVTWFNSLIRIAISTAEVKLLILVSVSSGQRTWFDYVVAVAPVCTAVITVFVGGYVAFINKRKPMRPIESKVWIYMTVAFRFICAQ